MTWLPTAIAAVAGFLCQLEPRGPQVVVALRSDAGGYALRKEAAEDAAWIAERTGADPFVLGSIAARESAGGRPGLVRRCRKWEAVPGGRRCVEEKTCWSGCTRAAAWDDRLDCGVWGIRDAPPPGSSWLRRHRKVTGRALPETCAMQRECSRRLVAWMVEDLRRWTPRDCGWPCVEANAWLGPWNGCDSCVRHVLRATAKRWTWRMRRATMAAIGRVRTWTDGD